MEQTPSIFSLFLPFIIIFFIFYFLVIRPQTKERKKHEEMINSLGKNDEVVTVGGIHGIVSNVKDKTIILKIDDNVKIEVDKSAISYVKKKRVNL